jgi:DNA polymerase I-like protein with 3'-5' exonuclease and polymerase domains
VKVLNLTDARNLPVGSQERAWAYNALDVTGTREVADVILPRLNESQQRIYAYERALTAPATAMMDRGFNVDQMKRQRLITELKRELAKDLRKIGKIKLINDVWDLKEKETGTCLHSTRKDHKHVWPRAKKGEPKPDEATMVCSACGTPRLKPKPFNANSSHDVDHLMYDLLKVPVMTNKKGQRSADGDILERIGNKYESCRPITDAIFDIRDKKKQLGSLNARLTKSGRYASSFNIGAAWTGRQSSSKNPYGEGGNAQNVAPRHRLILTADPGKELVYADLKQAESNVVAHISGDATYIDAHLSGDVHTYVARLVWPELPWNGDLKKDKAIAKRLPEWDNVEGHDFRFQAKRIQHGSNFGLTPPGISMIARIPIKQAYKAQENYFDEFPFIRGWQQGVAQTIKEHKPLVNILGREITLFGRPWDPHTVKQGLAFIPQSSVADIVNLAMLRIWRTLDPEVLELLSQVHDALIAQYKVENREVLHKMKALMEIPIPVNGRIMIIQPEIAYGRNWGHRSDDNPNGIWEDPAFN